jgi:hypothetical protein
LVIVGVLGQIPVANANEALDTRLSNHENNLKA